MPVLYVDVDGTIAFGEKTNYALVDAVKEFLQQNEDWDLVVWSYTGIDHARHWAEKTLAEWQPEIEPKDPGVATPEDIVIDDKHEMPGQGQHFLPRDFVRRMRDGVGVERVGL